MKALRALFNLYRCSVTDSATEMLRSFLNERTYANIFPVNAVSAKAGIFPLNFNHAVKPNIRDAD